MNTLISIDNATVTLRGLKALSRINLNLKEGGHISLLGPNGSGKSTLLRLLRGEVWPDQQNGGRIIWHTPQGPDDSPLSGRAMCALCSSAQQQLYVSQRHNIIAQDLILAGLADSHLLYSAPTDEARRKLAKIAGDLNIEPLLKRRLPSLSHGQIRIILLARAMIRSTRVLLLDECAEGLDKQARSTLYAMLEKASSHSTIVSASHREENLPFIKETIHLDHGEIVRPPEKIAHPPLSPQSDNAETDKLPPAALRRSLIEIKNADVYVDRAKVLHNINWSIKQGEQWLLLGPNGAGKSTLLRLLAGYEHPAAGGDIKRFLHDYDEEPDANSVKRNIRLVSDLVEAQYDYDLSAKEITLSGLESSIGLYRSFDEKETNDAEQTLKSLGITHLAEQKLSTLSTGQQRLVFLARALIGRPHVILLDEPFAGLDKKSGLTLMKILETLAKRQNAVTFVLASHHDEDFPQAFKNKAILENGRLKFKT